MAERLSHELNEITLIDNDFEGLEKIKQKLDIKVIYGLPSSPKVLKSANIQSMDMILAMVMNDEINILACQLANVLAENQDLVKIARIHSPDYLENKDILKDFNIDEIINPESLVSEYLENLIKHPGISQLVKFLQSSVHMFAFRVEKGSQMDGRETKDIHEFITGVPIRIPIIFRDSECLLPEGNTVIQAGDEVYFITHNTVHSDDIARFVLKKHNVYKNIVIAGGGHIGMELAKKLEHSHNVYIIEKDKKRCDEIVDLFTGSTVILNGSAEDHNMLEEANIDNCDLFFAASNFDEINILACIVAKNMGARNTTCLVNNHKLVPIAENNIQIDLALSPDRVTIGYVSKHMRKRQAIAVHPLRKGFSELIEVEVSEQNNFFAKGKIVDEIELPKSVSLAAIFRDGQMLEPHGNTLIKEFDHLILIVADTEVMPHLVELLLKSK